MNDDIVTRLRNFHDQRDTWQTLTEAADEIERLQRALDLWKKIAERMFNAHGHYVGDETWCDAHASDTAQGDSGYQELADEYKKAVRDGVQS